MEDRTCCARAPCPHGRRARRRTQGTRGEALRPRLQIAGVAVITGASSGIGEATARALAARGYRCILVARREDRLRTLASELNGEFDVCDVTDPGAVERTAAAIRSRHPAVDVLINNAGIPGRAGFVTIDAERLETVMRTNYFGAVWFARAMLPALEAADEAHVVNVVSVAGTVAWAPAGPYAASKHAQLAFSRALTAELRPRGIHVHTVNPGFVETEGFPQSGVVRNKLLRRIVIAPDDVARHIVRVIERDKRETFVPRWYRAAAIAQTLLPGVIARVVGRAAR